jgi:hypothetical protein
MLAVT